MAILVGPPAGAQEWPVESGWSGPREHSLLESDEKIVLTFYKAEPGRIVYWTRDGACSTDMPVGQSPAEPCAPPARAPEDYGTVRGEVTFTEAGSRTITIPIVDDDLEESDEVFAVHSSEGEDAAQQMSLYSAIVRIEDDDGRRDDTEAPAAATTTTRLGVRASGSTPVVTLPSSRAPAGFTRAPTTPPSPSPNLEVESADAELRPGSGFELVGDGDAEAARQGGREDSAPWLALGVGSVAVSSTAVAWVRRRRRWSANS